MTTIKSIKTQLLDLPPSCIEICPWNDRCFAIGTYLLENETATDHADDKSLGQKRSGSVLLFSLNEPLDEFVLLETHKTDYAIFDLHFPSSWSEQGNFDKSVWTANSTGSLTRHGISNTNFQIEESHLLQIWEKDVLLTYFAFHPTSSRLVGVTLASGEVMLCHLSADLNSTDAVVKITSHDLEAWCLSFTGSGIACFSGGDDGILQYVRMALSDQEPTSSLETKDLVSAYPSVQYKDRRGHTAGVTAILSLAGSDIFLTGSYDDRLRIIQNGVRPKVLKEANLEGGVWRLSQMERFAISGGFKIFILASCMHAGSRIVEIIIYEDGSRDPIIHVLAKFEEHESMNYGGACILRNGEYTVLSTSFYDRRLCLWKYQNANNTVPQT